MRKINFGGFFTVLLLAGGLQVAVAQLVNVCLQEEDGSRLPLATHCSRFVVCQNGEVSIIGSCPRGLHFNRELRECDFQWRANCLGLVAFEGVDDQCTCNCCADECQDPVDDEPSTVDCNPETSTSTTTTSEPDDDASDVIVGPSGTTCSSQSVCAGQEDGQKFADPDSNGYVVCQCQCPIAMPCPKGLKFNESAQVCDWVKTNASAADLEVLCLGDLVYNATSNQCDWPENYVPNVVCNNTSPVCQNQTEGELFPVEGKCNMFYKCNFNCAVEQYCPNNLIYNQKKKDCVYRQDYDCPWEYTAPSGPNAGPSGTACESNGRCLGEPEGTYLKSTTSCGKFVVCQCECEVEMDCPAGLYWNQDILSCNYKDQVACTL